MKWIKVEDKLPERPDAWYLVKTYLVKFENGTVQTVYWADGWNCSYEIDWSVCRDHELKDVVAWIDPDDIED